MGFREQMPDTAVARILRGVTIVEKSAHRRADSTVRVPIGGYARRQYLDRDANSLLLRSAQALWCGANPPRALACQGLDVPLEVIRGLSNLARDPAAADAEICRWSSYP